ncbi:MAG TPA: hypothetical protein VLD18_07350, partial [Verrucomicrobiae bacterium]|nr:hypothetical protein [Verrucomicrobiae bacterium]
MLYERWQQVARLHADELALLDAASGQRWTFAQLAHAAEQFPLPDHRLATPRGNGPEFIVTVLAAWRVGRPVLPLEGEAPVVNEPLPAEVVHLKTTSGTTRASQLIGFTAEQLAADADQIVATMG